MDQPEVETEESSNDKAKYAGKNVSGNDKVCHTIVDVFTREDIRKHLIGRKHYQLARNRCIKQHVEEILVVIEADAVGDPRTMVVHFKNAPVTLRAVVTSIRLGSQTSLAHSYTTVLLPLEA
jgi:hypothetical protein